MKLAAEHFEPADVIAVFVSEKDAIQLARRDPALLEPDHDLPRAQPAIDQNPTMIGRDQSAIPRAAAAEHGQSEHARLVAETGAFHNWKWKTPQTRIRDAPNRQSNAPEAPNTKIQAPKKQQYSNIKSRGPAI